MTTSMRRSDDSIAPPTPGILMGRHEASQDQPAPAATVSHRSIDILRIALGLVFGWAFVDKLFGLGYSTAGGRAWLDGGSPANGFLGHVAVGPLESLFRSMAGVAIVDWLFMLGLLGVGAALLIGVALRPAALVGSILLALMWIAEWPPAQYTSNGDPTGSTNPLVDYHLIYALGLIAVAALGVASRWGLGHWWSQRKIVADHTFLL